MKPRPTQFGVRENTASSGQHAPRPAVSTDSHVICIENEDAETRLRSPSNDRAVAGYDTRLHAALRNAATVAKRGDNTESSALSMPTEPEQKLNRPFEPLIDSSQAVKLLGNIHVKTLQRYARRGSLPGYQIGGHWFFRQSELDAWLRSRINSSCHPCRLD
jgi:excisionase family DNA binding protein